MPKYAGVWIDREKAHIVSLGDGDEKIVLLKSGVDKHVRLAGGSRSKTPYGPQDQVSESTSMERRKHQLRRYFLQVIDHLKDAEEVIVFGPGETKGELVKEIKRFRGKGRSTVIAGVEPADKMTERQIAARVRSFFAPKM